MEYNQEYLNKLTDTDYCGFLKNVDNWCNHRPLLYLALELSGIGSVLELGCGDGSTNHLHCVSMNTGRHVVSYDYNQKWLEKYKHLTTEDHEFNCSADPSVLVENCCNDNTTVCLVDHSPGERRWKDIAAIASWVDFVIIHDSEANGQGGYMLDKIWHLYSYRININANGACAALVSNTFDVTQFDGMKLGDFTLETKII